jgi:hypothetical protein
MNYRLTKMDEWPRHQAGGTFDVVVDGSPHWSDGYYFTMGDDRGDIAWFTGFRLHSNNDVLDAFTCISSAGRQYNMRWSRRLRPRIDDLDCGPYSVEIVEGLRTLNVRCGPNQHGISCDLRWDGFCPPYNEERVQTIVNGRLHADRSNYDQCSGVTGWIEFDGRRVEVNNWTGVRDHSWGIGNNTGGPRSRVIAPPLETPTSPGLRQWCVFRMPDRAIFWQFHHSAEGSYTKFESQCMYPYGDTRQAHAFSGVTHDIDWVSHDGVPQKRMAACTVALSRVDGPVERYRVETISYPVYLQGGGYWGGYNDALGRGVYRGDLHDEADIWDVSHPTTVTEPTGTVRFQRDAYAETWGRCTNLDDPNDTGSGHLECVVLGPYPGFDR